MRNLGSAAQSLEQRKHTTPSSVIVLEALSAVLPDDTYVTELRIDGEKLQIVGVTSDAPSLIKLIEIGIPNNIALAAEEVGVRNPILVFVFDKRLF